MEDYSLAEGERRKRIGTCAVDSGQILIADPCYLTGDKFNESQYKEVCELTTIDDDMAGELYFENGQSSMAVAASSGYGDGCYPVYAVYAKDSLGSERVCRLEIDFF